MKLLLVIYDCGLLLLALALLLLLLLLAIQCGSVNPWSENTVTEAVNFVLFPVR